MDFVSHYGARTAGQTSIRAALVTAFRQATKPTVERGAAGFRWPLRFEFGSNPHAESPDRYHRAAGEAHGYR
ncbi:hypothetical protein [Halorarum halobium]|uniref:hypothetical protein n=1 Tax=Halorarum halobium TaxID=3075121 RepID=UPI0028AE0351|nr:hypothetical protein [Halobaculum sp. XH14]